MLPLLMHILLEFFYKKYFCCKFTKQRYFFTWNIEHQILRRKKCELQYLTGATCTSILHRSFTTPIFLTLFQFDFNFEKMLRKTFDVWVYILSKITVIYSTQLAHLETDLVWVFLSKFTISHQENHSVVWKIKNMCDHNIIWKINIHV